MSPLPVPYFVYGEVTDQQNKDFVSNVTISGNSSSTSVSEDTDSSGKYQINIQDYASDGDTVKVIATYGSYYTSDTFSLSLGDLPKEINLTFKVINEFYINHVPDKYVKINYVPGNKIYVTR